MSNEAWQDLVAVFCVRRGLTTIDGLLRLKRSDHYVLAHRMFHCGGSAAEVQRMLEKAAEWQQPIDCRSHGVGPSLQGRERTPCDDQG